MSPQRLARGRRGSTSRQHLRRPMLWILVLILVLMAWGLSIGRHAHLVGRHLGRRRPRPGSPREFANAYVLSISVFLFYTFFVAVAAGMAVIRDDELKVGELLHATPLTPGEYVWGKFLAVVVAFSGVLAVHLLAMVVLQPRRAQRRGRRDPRPVRCSPTTWSRRSPSALPTHPVRGRRLLRDRRAHAGGRSWCSCCRWRRCCSPLFFLWNWSPSWLDPAAEPAAHAASIRPASAGSTRPGSRWTAASTSTTPGASASTCRSSRAASASACSASAPWPGPTPAWPRPCAARFARGRRASGSRAHVPPPRPSRRCGAGNACRRCA